MATQALVHLGSSGGLGLECSACAFKLDLGQSGPSRLSNATACATVMSLLSHVEWFRVLVQDLRMGCQQMRSCRGTGNSHKLCRATQEPQSGNLWRGHCSVNSVTEDNRTIHKRE